MYRVTWIENDGSISKVETTFSKYLAKEMQKSGLIAKEVGYIKDCTLEEVSEQMNDKQTEHIADSSKMIETETWNSMHGKVVMPKGTFDKLYELAKQNKEQDDDGF